MGQSENKIPVSEIGLDISTRPAAAHLDLTKPPDLEMTHNATGLGDITKPANLELSDLDVSNNLEITKPEFNNDSCIDQEVNGASKIEDIELGIGNLSLREDLNPFDTDIHSRLLKMIPQPVEKRHGFVDLRGEKLPNIRPHSNVMIGDSEFFCMECKGKLN